jgi:arginase
VSKIDSTCIEAFGVANTSLRRSGADCLGAAANHGRSRNEVRLHKAHILMTATPFDLVLSYAQWQGSARPENLVRGAREARRICARYGTIVEVPLSTDETVSFGVRRWGAIFDQFRSAQEILARHRPHSILTAGGDCAVDVAIVEYLNSVHDDLLVVWIDTHLDANTPESSPSGSFHGMPVSAIMGHAPEPMKAQMKAPLAPSRFRYFGVRLGDEGDRAFERDHELRTLDLDLDLDLRGPVHIHFDLDVLEPTEFPHLAYPEPGGLPLEKAVEVLGRIADEADVVGLTITEFGPKTDADAKEGGTVIARLCEVVAARSSFGADTCRAGCRHCPARRRSPIGPAPAGPSGRRAPRQIFAFSQLSRSNVSPSRGIDEKGRRACSSGSRWRPPPPGRVTATTIMLPVASGQAGNGSWTVETWPNGGCADRSIDLADLGGVQEVVSDLLSSGQESATHSKLSVYVVRGGLDGGQTSVAKLRRRLADCKLGSSGMLSPNDHSSCRFRRQDRL